MTIRLHGSAAPQIAGRDRVDDAVLGLPHDRGRQVLVAECGGIFGEPDGFLGHAILLPEIALQRIKPWKASAAKSMT